MIGNGKDNHGNKNQKICAQIYPTKQTKSSRIQEKKEADLDQKKRKQRNLPEFFSNQRKSSVVSKDGDSEQFSTTEKINNAKVSTFQHQKGQDAG